MSDQSTPTPPRDRAPIEAGTDRRYTSARGVNVGGDIHGDIHTGDYYDVDYDPTGLKEAPLRWRLVRLLVLAAVAVVLIFLIVLAVLVVINLVT